MHKGATAHAYYLLRMRTNYTLDNHYSRKSLSGSCSCSATCQFLSVAFSLLWPQSNVFQTIQKVMTDDSAPPSTPPPPRSPGGSQGPEAIHVDLPRALSVAENLLLAIREAQSQSGASRTPGKLGSITPVYISVWGAAALNATPPLRIGV